MAAAPRELESLSPLKPSSASGSQPLSVNEAMSSACIEGGGRSKQACNKDTTGEGFSPPVRFRKSMVYLGGDKEQELAAKSEGRPITSSAA
jgi:hypothetical protein